MDRPGALTGLDGASVLVTGASGGIGSVLCAWLRDQGAVVHAADREPGADRAGFVEVDVTDPASVDAAVAQVLSRSGRLDALVAAAGVSEESTPAEDVDVAVWDATMAVNLRGAFLTCRAAGRTMLAQGGGRIVAIASMSGTHVVNTPQRQVAYNVSKAGVAALVRSLAHEWAPRGVRVNALSPGYVGTPMVASKVDLHDTWRAAIPAARFATPLEVAAATGWLLSDQAAYCVGTELLMDGGYSLA